MFDLANTDIFRRLKRLNTRPGDTLPETAGSGSANTGVGGLSSLASKNGLFARALSAAQNQKGGLTPAPRDLSKMPGIFGKLFSNPAIRELLEKQQNPAKSTPVVQPSPVPPPTPAQFTGYGWAEDLSRKE
ncbi:hypothetical protein HNR62_000291 [Oceanisphaera litoralis]|uniref:hypothetical protein n=1 Tax=Oceanisphaera litoralis TaxID=225144 RepID=UPI0019593F23|nr:hypothetical protein [Oceanisphaera litoralis]MBM7454462.1 hypothetical protein [Oceanisphaera litoralis]